MSCARCWPRRSAQHGLSVDPRHAGTFFEQLRLLSGRLAFKLASATASQRTEVLGLALARLYLDYQGALADQVVVPLDDHLELYRDARRSAARTWARRLACKRTDLALWSLDARRRMITCRLVEVKCYSALRGGSGFEQLKERIAAQLRRSESVLAARFDPAHDLADRPDRAVRNAELAGLLRFYLGRAVTARDDAPDAAAEAEWLLGNLDSGRYQLRFTRTGLIFDLSAPREPVRGRRRDRVPPDRAGPHRGTAGGAVRPMPVLAAEAAAARHDELARRHRCQGWPTPPSATPSGVTRRRRRAGARSRRTSARRPRRRTPA